MFLIENNSNFNFKASSLRNMISADSPQDIKSIRWGFSPDINNLHLVDDVEEAMYKVCKKTYLKINLQRQKDV